MSAFQEGEDGEETKSWTESVFEQPKSKQHRQQKYRNAWESDPAFTGWLKPVAGCDSKALCRRCNKQMVAEITVLKNHAKSTKHKKKCLAPAQCSQLDAAVRTAEVKLAGFLAEHSVRASDQLMEVMKDIFKDSRTAQNISLIRPMAAGSLMEVCVDSVESAVNAERGGAGRLELCTSLLEGGLTPSTGLLQIVKQYVKIPVYVMIRPRGGDFLYSDQEVQVMRRDIELMKSHGADGLVLGALTGDGRVDAELCMELLAASHPLPVTFHRAFDMAHDAAIALETLVSLGFERVLTSGCDNSALEGLPLIKRLVEQAKGRITIMPGGGITERNLQRILEGSGAQEFHCSARSSKDSAMKFRNSCVTMGASFSAPEYGLKVADVSKVCTLNAIAKNTL